MSNKGDNNHPTMQYLYGAAVQGIQGFIFQTNSLAEIVGASELVEEICTSLFYDVLDKCGITKKDDCAIVNAAGNIKYIFTSEEDCQKVVRIFPKIVTEHAPGITISQAVVNMRGKEFAEAVQELESNLRVQRNKLMRDTTIGLMGIERSRQTGLPVTHIENGDHMDEGTFLKLYAKRGNGEKDKIERKETTQKLCVKAFGQIEASTYNANKIPFDIADMTESNDWIAIIHADGNGLGQVVQKIGIKPDKFKKFSQQLDKATTEAAVKAFNSLGIANCKKIPMRPIVLSGDDHTVICRADLAIPYTEAFIKNFEELTKTKLGDILKGEKDTDSVFTSGENYLTACAGIAFIKSSYPFYYGYQLAESLCERAKKDTKELYDANNGNLPASCIMFHKVQDCFITSYNDIVKRELTPQPNISFEFGPYYVHDGLKERWSVKMLQERVKELDEEGMKPVKSGLRNWLSLIHLNSGMADQRLERLKKISGKDKFINDVTVSRENDRVVYPVYDILAINSVHTQNTKKKDEKAK